MGVYPWPYHPKSLYILSERLMHRPIQIDIKLDTAQFRANTLFYFVSIMYTNIMHYHASYGDTFMDPGKPIRSRREFLPVTILKTNRSPALH